MAVNREAFVRQIDSQYPHLLRYNTPAADVEFLQRLLAVLPDDPQLGKPGLLTKSPGERGYTLPNGHRVSYDVIAFRNGERIDVIAGGNAHPTPAGPGWIEIPPDEWRPHNVYIDASDWPTFDSETPRGTESPRAELGIGWFCLLRALQDWPEEAKENRFFLVNEMNPRVLRVMLNVEGLHHVRPGSSNFGMPDPWSLAGVDPTSVDWDGWFARALDFVGEVGWKLFCTLHGGHYYLPTYDDRRRFNDRIVEVLERGGYWPAIYGFEIANEYRVNGWNEDMVRDAGRDLKSKVPDGMLIGLSSPDAAHNSSSSTSKEEMLAAMELLYRGDRGGANIMPIHRSRDASSPWANPFNYNPLRSDLPKGDNEPAGQGASAGGNVNDPGALVEELKRTSDAGWLYYWTHNAWCVWNGHMPMQWLGRLSPEHSKRFIRDITNMKAVANGLRDFRESGSIVEPLPPPTPPTPAPGVGVLLGGQFLLPGQTLVSPGGHARLHNQEDGNLVVYLDGKAVWSSNSNDNDPGRLEMQVDGNMVLYGHGRAKRATQTHGHPGAMVQLQDDGNFVIYEDPSGPRAGTPIWASASNEFFS